MEIDTSLARKDLLKAITATYSSEIDRRLGQIRDVLGTLDANRSITCSAADAMTRAEAMIQVPQLKLIAILSPDGKQLCSSLPIAAEPSAEFAEAAIDIGPIEHFDVVTLKQTGVIAVRIQRKVANSPNTLAAIVPLVDCLIWLNASLERDRLQSARLRLTVGKRPLLEISGDRSVDNMIAPPSLPISDGILGEESVPGDRLAISVTSGAFPLTTTLLAPLQPPGFFDARRLVTDASLCAALIGLCLIVFRRRSVQDFGASRFDQAIRRGEFDVAYRPIIDLRSGKLAGAAVEMLWRRNGGIVLPSSDFVPAIVRSGFESQILRYALKKCQSDLSEAYKLRPRLQLKVAIAHETLARTGFLDELRRGLAASSLAPQQLVIALAEIGQASDPDRSRAVIRDLQRIGVQLELRQSVGEISFGAVAGDAVASSVGLDIRLMEALDSQVEIGSEAARAWIANIVAAGSRSAVRVCAYRVKSFDVLKQLKALGVDDAEGEALSPALTAGSFMALVARAGLDRTEPAQAPGARPSRAVSGL